MAWIYLAESEESLKPFHPGFHQLPTVKTTEDLNPFYFAVWQTVRFLLRQFGMISQPSLDQCCHRSIFSTEVFPARMLALQELEKAWTASEPAYSVKQLDLFENVSLSSFSSKMSQASEDMCMSSGASLRRLATIAGMGFCQQQRSVPTTKETDGGYWATPTASEVHGYSPGTAKKVQARIKQRDSGAQIGSSLKWEPRLLQEYKQSGNGHLNPTWLEWLMGYRVNWTESEPWAMRWFLSARRRRSKPCVASK